MATPNFKHALFCAIVTLIIAYPILGLNLVAQGTTVGLEGATTSTVISVILAAVVVFLFQLFRDSIMGNLGKLPKLNPLSGREPMPQAKRAKLESWVLTAIVVFALRSEEHTSELQSRPHLVCRLLLEKKKKKTSKRQRTISEL